MIADTACPIRSRKDCRRVDHLKQRELRPILLVPLHIQSHYLLCAWPPRYCLTSPLLHLAPLDLRAHRSRVASLRVPSQIGGPGPDCGLTFLILIVGLGEGNHQATLFSSAFELYLANFLIACSLEIGSFLHHALSLHKVFHPSTQFDAHDEFNDDVSSSILITSTNSS